MKLDKRSQLSLSTRRQDKGPQIVGEATAAINDVQELQANCTDETRLEESMDKLNVDQSRVFKRMSEHLHESGVCKCSQLQPLQMFVSGVGRTGKSFLIEAI